MSTEYSCRCLTRSPDTVRSPRSRTPPAESVRAWPIPEAARRPPCRRPRPRPRAGTGIRELPRTGDIALDPGIVDRPVPAGGGDDEFAVDQQEAAILARGEEPVQPRPGNPQRPLVLTQKRFGIRPERIVPVEHSGTNAMPNGSADLKFREENPGSSSCSLSSAGFPGANRPDWSRRAAFPARPCPHSRSCTGAAWEQSGRRAGRSLRGRARSTGTALRTGCHGPRCSSPRLRVRHL